MITRNELREQLTTSANFSDKKVSGAYHLEIYIEKASDNYYNPRPWEKAETLCLSLRNGSREGKDSYIKINGIEYRFGATVKFLENRTDINIHYFDRVDNWDSAKQKTIHPTGAARSALYEAIQKISLSYMGNKLLETKAKLFRMLCDIDSIDSQIAKNLEENVKLEAKNKALKEEAKSLMPGIKPDYDAGLEIKAVANQRDY